MFFFPKSPFSPLRFFFPFAPWEDAAPPAFWNLNKITQEINSRVFSYLKLVILSIFFKGILS